MLLKMTKNDWKWLINIARNNSQKGQGVTAKNYAGGGIPAMLVSNAQNSISKILSCQHGDVRVSAFQ